MKRIYAILAAVVICGFGFSALNAAEKAASAKTKTVAVKEVKVVGIVTAVDAAQSTITVKAKKGEETFKTAGTTKISHKLKNVELADIKAGQKVKVTAKDDVASKIEILK